MSKKLTAEKARISAPQVEAHATTVRLTAREGHYCGAPDENENAAYERDDE
jgi:hypothetical protein